jgi:hypothetical protein
VSSRGECGASPRRVKFAGKSSNNRRDAQIVRAAGCAELCAGDDADSHDLESKMTLHGRKVTVIVEQGMTMLDAEGPDDEIGGLADRNTQFPQLAIVPCGVGGQFSVQELHDSIRTQSAFDAQGVSLIPGALENFEQDEIADQQWFPHCRGFQFGGRLRSLTAQVGDPDGGVDEDHGRPGERP